MSGGNFRLLTRLLTQVERILKVNQSEIVSKRDCHRRERQSGHRTRLNSCVERLRQIALKYVRHIAIQATVLRSSGSSPAILAVLASLILDTQTCSTLMSHCSRGRTFWKAMKLLHCSEDRQTFESRAARWSPDLIDAVDFY
jgi:hypothetical protein